MPELPEVETVARRLRDGERDTTPSLIGFSVREARALWPREIHGHTPTRFAQRVAGARFTAIGRHGKYLIFTLQPAQNGAPPRTMLVHLKMSGRLDVVREADAFTPHARVVWLLNDGFALRFDDARKFGRVYLVDDPRDVIGDLGPDALAMGDDEFVARLLKKKGAIKPILLDQTFVAGVGNIYADEALFRARLRPKRLAATLKPADARRLFVAVQDVLREGIAANGASFDWVYPSGEFQRQFRVYGQTAKPCAECGTPIKRILVGQRSTHYCPTCQR